MDDYVVHLETFLTLLAKDSLKSSSGSYIGDGTNKKTITFDFIPKVVIISKYVDLGRNTTWPVSGNVCIALLGNVGIAYIPGTGFVKDAITDMSVKGLSLGVNVNVNEANKQFIYLAIG